MRYILMPAMLILVMLPSMASASLNVPLTVTDYAGVNRAQDPVTTGVPLPSDAGITSTAQLRITDSLNNPVPAQFTVMARWNGLVDDGSKPIKWVLMDFQADASSNGMSIYYLKDSGQYSFASSLSVQDQADKITVSTGKAKFQISKTHFNLFDYVWIDKDGDGTFTDAIVSQPNSGGITLTDSTGKQFTTMLEAPEQILIEEQGPLRSVVKIRGVLKASDGTYFAPAFHNPAQYPRYYQPYPHSFVYYNVRITFYNNKEYAKVAFTLEQNGAQGSVSPETSFAPRQVIYFTSINLDLSPAFSQTNIRTEDGLTTLSSGESMTLFQGWKENLANLPFLLENSFAAGIEYQLKKNGQITKTGSTNPGWIEASDGSNNINIAFKDFWENFYKKYTVTNSGLKIGFWPEGGYYPFNQEAKNASTYMISGGRHKTHEMLIGFYGGTKTGYAQQMSKAFEEPLMAIASSSWYAQTNAFGMIAPAGITTSDSTVNAAIARYEKAQRTMISTSDSDNGISLLSQRTDNASYPWGRKWKFWGWINFGDYLWKDDVYSDGHEAFAYSILLQYLRSGDRRFFDAGAEMVKHRYDVDQYHGDRNDTQGGAQRWYNYFQRFEQEKHSDTTGGNAFWISIFGEGDEASIPDYTWNNDLTLYYLLTGDRKALEAAEETGQGVKNWFGSGGLINIQNPTCTSDIMSSYTRSLFLALNLYRVNGDPALLDISNKIAKNIILYREQQLTTGGAGHFGMDAGSGAVINYCLSGTSYTCQPGGCGNCKNVEWMDIGNIYEVMMQLHMETGNSDLASLIIRMADFISNAMYGGTYADSTHYKPIQMSLYWLQEDKDGLIRKAAGNPAGSGDFSKSSAIADLLAYAYRLTNNSAYLAKARTVFKDYNFYYAYGGYPADVSIDPSTRFTISASTFATKESALRNRQGQVYLSEEASFGSVVTPLSITTLTLPSGTISTAYSNSVSATGGTSPYSWTTTSGSLPAGLTLNPSGLISGIPNTAGTSTFTVRVTDAVAATAFKSLSITIAAQQDTTPPVISGVAVSSITPNSATITWTTDDLSDSQADYGQTTGYGSSTALDSAMTTAHSRQLSGLSASTLYHYRAKSRNAAGNLSISSDYTFTTAAADTTPPVISSVSSSSITSSGATVTWSTNEASDSQVEYGTTSSYGQSTTMSTAMVTSHSQALTGLSASTLYHFRVKSRDAAGNPSASADFTFATPAAAVYKYLIDPPSPYDVKIGKGCTTAYHIDEDCDNYGIGDGLLGPDADDNDPNVNTLSSVEAKYGSTTSGNYLNNIRNFFCTSRGVPYCNIGNIYFVSPAGNDASGAANDINHPYLTAAYVFTHGFSPGDMILLRTGTYTDIWELDYMTAKNGYSKTKPNIVAGMPGETAILQGDGIHVKINGMSNWYWVFDTFQIGRTDLDTHGDGLHLYGAHNIIFRNLFLPRNGAAMWMMTGTDRTCREIVTVTEDLADTGTPQTRNLTDCSCATDVIIDKMVAYGSGADGETHQFYWGCAGAHAYDSIPYNDLTRPSVLANCIVRKLISHSSQAGYEGFQMNGLASNLVIEDSFFHTDDTSGINFLNGVWSSTIRNNVIWNNEGNGIRFNLYNSIWMQPIKDNIVEHNTIFVGKNPNANNPTNGNAALSGDIWLASTTNDTKMVYKGNTFRNNILVNYGSGTYQPPISVIYQSYLSDNYFQNNVFYRTDGGTNVAGYCSAVVTDGQGGTMCSGSLVTLSLSSFQNTFRNSSGNVLSNPMFVTPVSAMNDYQNSPGKFDFRLLPGSPAINLGIANGLNFDVIGNTRTGNPDAGAYEYTGIATYHRSDINQNGCIEMSELSAFINRWKVSNVDVSLREIIEAIGLWKRGC